MIGDFGDELRVADLFGDLERLLPAAPGFTGPVGREVARGSVREKTSFLVPIAELTAELDTFLKGNDGFGVAALG